jgi:hypothetical protein
MIERTMIRLATAIGATVWLARIVFYRSERDKLDTAMQALDTVTFSGVNDLGYQPAIRNEWTR